MELGALRLPGRGRVWFSVLLLPILLAACAPAPPGRIPARPYFFLVPLDATFDLAQGRTLTLEEAAARLTPPSGGGPRMLFLGEHHNDARSHRAQLDLLNLVERSGRPLAVALEMFPPSADAALEDWRQGRVSEEEFLEQSGWFESWGFPWALYRDLFLWVRERRVPLLGVNADEATRTAVRQGRLKELSPALQEEIGALDEDPEPHRQYMGDELGAEHDAIAPGSQAYQSMLRVQLLWDRLMGLRAARLAEAQTAERGPPAGMVALLIGSGHLAYKLGANLHAARISALPQITVWDDVVPAELVDAQGRTAVAVGIADWVRVYREDSSQPQYPSLAGVRLVAAAQGVKVEKARAGAALLAGDTILALNGEPARSPARLRLAFERLPWNTPARFTVLRADREMEVQITPHSQGDQ